jgi:DNA-binding winged helix-turn-helix (wHTH) protein
VLLLESHPNMVAREDLRKRLWDGIHSSSLTTA